MLTYPEKIAFLIFAAVMLTWSGVYAFRIVRAIGRGRGRPDWQHIRATLRERLLAQLLVVGTNLPVFFQRPLVGVFHFMIFAGFSFYFLVNVFDAAAGYFSEFETIRSGDLARLFSIYDLAADLLSVGALTGMVALLIRRFIRRDPAFNFRANVLLNEHVRAGAIHFDSLTVGIFILLHVGSRWLGRGMQIAANGQSNWLEPTASLAAIPLAQLPAPVLQIGIHVTWWSALGLILLFFPYFVRSKHIHIFFAPLNWFFFRDRPVATTEEDGAGAKHLQDLTWHQVMDSYACIMCNRCQDACPAYAAGTSLSPAALEINKRYYLNQHLADFVGGKSSPPLWEFAISKEAAWACTTCGACVEVCPVGNTPMVDIIDIRRALIAEGDTLDANLQKSLENLSKQGNSFGQSSRTRAKWTQALDFKIKDARKEQVDYLWFVGDFASFDPRGQESSRLFARVLRQAGVDFGILHEAEWNSGNDVRRAGEEGLFEMLAEHNVAAISQAKFREGIITTDPHTLNALRFEYAKLGQTYQVAHYTRTIEYLLREEKIKFARALKYRVTYHDPCYLGRYNRAFDAPRYILERLGVELIEMPRNRANSFCCGAGGGQIWKGAGVPGEKPAENRIREALTALANPDRKDVPLFIVACPKDVAMYTDAVKTSGNEGKIIVKDIIELVGEAMELKPGTLPAKPIATPIAEKVAA
ncbi:MAG: (Fe-S)-binding protein [Chloroflexi bacterium]|nr:(Fe-S)-binding protein [Chloroflexota bacterium]